MAKERATETEEPPRGRSEEQRPARREEGTPSAAMPGALPLTSPFTVMRRFMDDLDRLFDSFGPGLVPRIEVPPGTEARERAWIPPLEIFEREGQLVVRADVPGLSRDQIRVEIEHGQLTISGERMREHEERRSGLYRSERSYGSFHRTIPLPEGVDPEQAKASFNNGVLEITMPLPRHARARRLDIQEGSHAAQQKGPSQSTAKSA